MAELVCLVTAERPSGHVFISYVREDRADAEQLAEALKARGEDVWLDRDRLMPGVRWQAAIRDAIEAGAFFIACFSERSISRDGSYMHEELTIAGRGVAKAPSRPHMVSPRPAPLRHGAATRYRRW